MTLSRPDDHDHDHEPAGSGGLRMRVAFALLLSALMAALLGCARPEHTAGGGDAGAESSTLSLKGSDTMVILGQRWAEAYMKANPGATVQVTGGGSGTGIAALINGTTDICESSRPMKDKEREDVQAKRGAPVVETKVALDALAVYVHASNPLTEISLPALRGVYLGETKGWKAVGGPDHAIVLYGRENNSGTYGYFKEHVLENKDFAPAVQTLAGTAAVVSAVKGDAFGIGYGGIAYLEGIRALKVKKDDASPAIAPSLQTAQDASYPIARFLYFYTAGEPTGLAKRFIEWVKSAAGQGVIEQVGYYPLPKG
jgi:phosphate transport system substrate-binding protein